MANQEQLDILRQGVEVWNKWRKEYDDTIDLSGADVGGSPLPSLLLATNLQGDDFLIGINLQGIDLRDAKLSGANLSGADLSFADLGQADFSQADLRYVHFNETDLEGANLREANLYRADLTGAQLRNNDLWGANFNKVVVGWTIFGDIDLSVAKGLETAIHGGPSTIGIDTIIHSQGKIPETFLRDAGIPEAIIEAIPSLIGSLKPFDFYSCFISHSSKDDAFVKRLHADLKSSNVRCWFASEDLKWGEHLRAGIDEAIHAHDKLLLILSKHSVASGWVEHEVKTALAREKKEKRVVLFPVRVDNAVFHCPYAWAAEIQHEGNIGDFTRWKNHDEYQIAFERLLRDLRT